MKKSIMVILLVLVLFLISGCNNCSSKINKYDKADCLQDLALENNDESYCKKIHTDDSGIGGDSKKRACFLNLALKNNDKEYCEKSDGIFKFLENKLNIKNYDRLDCLSKYSILKNDLETCKSISEYETYYAICLNGLARINGDVKFCEEFTNNYFHPCIKNVAMAKEDTKICNLTNSSSIFHGSNKEDCIQSVAFSTLNIGFCNQIHNDNSTNNCISKIEGYIRNEKNCREKQGEDADFCWRNLADWTKNTDFCSNISSNKIENDCLLNILWTHHGQASFKN
ncbi:MAG: hypothetical protein GY861_10055 [bacterium]|nr:hypothetical protein [bacterium]